MRSSEIIQEAKSWQPKKRDANNGSLIEEYKSSGLTMAAFTDAASIAPAIGLYDMALSCLHNLMQMIKSKMSSMPVHGC